MDTKAKNILTEITRLTNEIENKYPEIIKYLDETRATLPQGDLHNAEMDVTSLENYRNGLEEMIEKYEKEH
ncbi:hypothetical protein ES677_04570 [Bizionia gelidisalsuginis]|uniref:Uncharacterized protein n=1 Tax=Bizionia gelidisalsuginis TaxID=291188 RepID=A0ABY3MCL6_9FLAO|nr:hypothetical protein [Bizionia gelidisalsuginis]TYC15620.1 hypothetical protein ES677_04570 [Bizionia gelidisalsuginis]